MTEEPKETPRRVSTEITLFLDEDPMDIEDAIKLYKDLEEALTRAGVNLDNL